MKVPDVFDFVPVKKRDRVQVLKPSSLILGTCDGKSEHLAKTSKASQLGMTCSS